MNTVKRLRPAGDDGNGSAAVSIQKIHKHAFVQALISNSFMPENSAKQLLARLLNTTNDLDKHLEQVMTDLNRDLSIVRLEVKHRKCPVDGERYVGLVNNTADEASKMGSHYSIAQRDFFKQMLPMIAAGEVHNGVPIISEFALLNVDVRAGATQAAPDAEGSSTQAAAAKKLTHSEKGSTLRKLLSDGWLASAPGKPGYYTFGPRSFLELFDYIMALEELNDAVHREWDQTGLM